MHYQDRIRAAASIVTDFLRQYQRPSHLDNDAALREISAIAEEMNGLVSTSSSPDEFKARIIEACRHIRQTYTQRAWPMPAHFIKALETVTAKASRSVAAEDKVASFSTSEQIAARRIIEREPVGDSWLYGKLALGLVRDGLVSEADLRDYRDGLRKNIERIYTADQVGEMMAKLERRHADAMVVSAGS